MSEQQERRLHKTLHLSPLVPMHRLLKSLRLAFEEARIVKVVGFPVRVFCLSVPEDVDLLFRDPIAANAKLQAIMPRVRAVMPNGSFAMGGGNSWTVRRQQVKKAFNRPEVAVYLNRIVKPIEMMLHRWVKHVDDTKGFDIYHAMRLITAQMNMRMFFSTHLDEDDLRDFEERTHFLETNFVRPLPLWVPPPG